MKINKSNIDLNYWVLCYINQEEKIKKQLFESAIIKKYIKYKYKPNGFTRN